VEFGILGPLAVWRDGEEVPIGAAKQRALLTLLLLRRGEYVPTETLVDELWRVRPPVTAVKTVQVYVSQLRKALGERLIETRPAGYRLRLDPDSVDAARFESLLSRARELLDEGEASEAGELVREALGLWRGPPLAEFRYEEFARDEIARVEELHLVGLELRLEAELALGRHAELVPELEALAREHPLREGPRRLLMLALYRAGRQGDALAVYQDARAVLVQQLGLEPGQSLRQLEKAILAQDPALDPPRQVRARPRPSLPPRQATGRPQPDSRARPAVRAGRGRLVVPLAGVSIAAAAAVTASALLLTRGGATRTVEASADSIGVFDPRSGRLTGQIPVGAASSAVAAGAGSLWVADVDAHSISRIDPAKQVVIDKIQVGNGPDGLAFGGGFVWVANGLDGTVSKIDPKTDTTVDSIQVGNGPAGIAVDGPQVWVANSSDGTVTRIDMRTDKTLEPVSVGQGADGVAAGYGSVWVTSEAGGEVTRIDTRTGTPLQPVHTGSGAEAVATGAGAVWVANSLDGTVTRIEPGSNSVRATIPVGDGPDGIAVLKSAIWVSNELAGTLTKIDSLNDVPSRPMKTGNRPEGLVAAFGSLFVAVRASGAGHRGGVLTLLTSSGDLDHLDPALTYSQAEGQVAVLTNDGLTGFRRVGGSAGTQLVPDLAVSLPVPTDGGRSYSFQVRPGIHYSTGPLVRPQDFRRAIERALALSRQGAYYAPYYADIVGAQRCLAAPKRPCDLSRGIVTDPASNTVTFRLRSPDPDFLYALALPSAFAVPAGTPLHPRRFVPATGPYEISSFDPKRGLRLVRNPRFREWSPAAQPSGFPDEIVERDKGSSDAQIAAVLHGSADLTSIGLSSRPPSPGVLGALQTQHASQLELDPWDITWFLALNTRIPPFDSMTARQALNFAIDRGRLRDLTIGRGLGPVTCQVLPPDFSGYRRYCPYTVEPSKDGAWTAPDLKHARQLVRSSGTTGQAVTVWMPKGLDEFNAATGRYVVSVLDSLGYKARYRLAADPFDHEDKLHLQSVFSGWYPDFAAPDNFIDPVLTCGSYNPVNTENTNFAEFCDPKIDREIARARSLQTTSSGAASQLWAEIDRDITDQAPWVAFANGDVLEVKSTRVGNYQSNPQWGTLLDELWVR
jgi:YVTN family beta-propeller protein